MLKWVRMSINSESTPKASMILSPTPLAGEAINHIGKGGGGKGQTKSGSERVREETKTTAHSFHTSAAGLPVTAPTDAMRVKMSAPE